MEAVEHVCVQARTLLRERAVDPLTEVDAVRTLVDQVVDDFLIACADGTAGVPGPYPAREDLVSAVTDAVAGFGPLQRYLDDPTIEEIWINDPSRVFVARNGRSELTPTVLSESAVHDLVERMLSTSGRRLDLSSPFVDAALPLSTTTSYVRT